MPGKMNKELFEKRAREVHGDKYGYVDVIYVNVQTKVSIECFIHGMFIQSPKSHLRGLGCKQCGIHRRTKKSYNTQQAFIEKIKKIHNCKYDYSKTIYTGSANKISIICPTHGEFEQIAKNHMQGKGCLHCGFERTKEARQKQPMKKGPKTKQHTQETFVFAAQQKFGTQYTYEKTIFTSMTEKIIFTCSTHGDCTTKASLFLYSKVGCKQCKLDKSTPNITTDTFVKEAIKIHGEKYLYTNANYVCSATPVKILCKFHGEFSQRPYVHLKGGGCSKCATTRRANKKIMTFDQFIGKAQKIHKNKYEYCKNSYSKVNNKLTIVCPFHEEFEQQGASHLRGNGCPKCTHRISKPELRWLDLIGIPDTKQCRQPCFYFNKVRYRPDGFDVNNNTIYEFLGDYWHGNLRRFKPTDFNAIVKKPFQKLHEETFEKFELFKAKGFKVVYIWESDFKQYEKWIDKARKS